MAGDPYVLTRMGVKFSLVDPRPEDVLLEDIIFSLAHLYRFTGHADPPWSVLDHTLYVHRLTEEERGELGREHRRALLLHDAAEAYVGDDSAPKKRAVPELKALEQRVQQAIAERFDLPVFWFEHEGVTRYDLMALRGEAEMFMPDDDFFDQFPEPVLEPIALAQPRQEFRRLIYKSGVRATVDGRD